MAACLKIKLCYTSSPATAASAAKSDIFREYLENIEFEVELKIKKKIHSGTQAPCSRI